MGWRRNQAEQDPSMLEGMGFAPAYPDATADVYGQQQGTGEPYVHTGPDGQLGVFVDGQFVRPLTYEEAMQATNFQSSETPEQPDVANGFSYTQELPSRGRISARVSVDFDAHGNPALLPDARELGVAMLASAGSLAQQQGGTQVRFEGYDDEADAAAQAQYGQTAYAQPWAPQQGYDAPAEQGWADATPTPLPYPNESVAIGSYDHPYEEPLTKREIKQIERAQREEAKAVAKEDKVQSAAAKAAAKAAAHEIAKGMMRNPVKVMRLGVAALAFSTVFNVLSGNMSTEPKEVAKAYVTAPWNAGSAIVWGTGKIIKIVK